MMRITFFSNFLNHHQTPFCDEMFKQLNENFTFVSTENIPESFIKNGYPDCRNYPYNLNSYIDETNYNKALHLGLISDIVIIGSASDVFINERLKQNKHTFRYSERLFKKGEWQIFDPRVLTSVLKSHTINRCKNLYMLCSSGYTANDLNLIFAYPDKKYKWGYFTNVPELDIEQVISQKPNEKIELLWTARFLKLKHPELAVKLAFELKKMGYNFHLNMIGTGVMLQKIIKMIERYQLTDSISLLANMKNAEVLHYMKKANIFLFTSNRNEGWGAVLNESMSCGCAVVASNMIGAVPYLIENGKNGLVFKSGSLSSLLEQTQKLLNDHNFRNNLSKNAYHSMMETWNANKAASNFMKLAESILEGKSITINDGPCSKALSTNKNNIL